MAEDTAAGMEAGDEQQNSARLAGRLRDPATLAVGALAQQPPAIGKQQLFPTPEAAADALNDAAKRGDSKALEAMLGAPWGALTPLQSDGFKRDLAAYFSQWDKQHKVTIDPASNGAKAIVEVGTTGWTLPMPDRQGRHGVALRFRRRLRRDGRARVRPQ